MDYKIMNFNIRKLTPLFIFFLVSTIGCADEELLKSLTSNDPQTRLDALKQIKHLQISEIDKLITLMEDPNYDISQAARIALESFVATIGAPDIPKESSIQINQILCENLKKDISTETKRYLMRVLSWIANEESLEVLSPLLLDKELGDECRAILERIPGESAIKALAQALPQASPEQQIGILQTIKQKQPDPLPNEVIAIIPGATEEVLWYALETAAASGVPPTQLLPPEKLSTLLNQDRVRLGNIFITTGETLAKKQKQQEAEEIFLQALRVVQESHQHIAILKSLLDIQSRQGLILALQWIGTPEVFKDAFVVLTESDFPQLDEQLAAAFAREKGFRRAVLLKILAARNYSELPSLLTFAETDESAEVRLAAAQISNKLPSIDDFKDAFLKGSPLGLEDLAEFTIKTAHKLLEQQDKAAASKLATFILQSPYIPSLFLTQACDILEKTPSEHTASFLLELFGTYTNPTEYLQLSSAGKRLAPILENDNQIRIAIERAFAKSCKYLEKDKAQTILLNIVKQSPYFEVQQLASTTLAELGVNTEEIALELGYIVQWQILGPFNNQENKNTRYSFFPEEQPQIPLQIEYEGKTYSWKEVKANGIPALVNLRQLFELQEHCLAYAVTTVKLPNEVEGYLNIGSDDGCIVWLNGTKILEKPDNRKLVPDEDKIEVKFNEGNNIILVKIMQDTGAWQFTVRLTDLENNPLKFSH